MDSTTDASAVDDQTSLAHGADGHGDTEGLEIPVMEAGDHGSDSATALAMSNDYSLYVQEGPGGDDSIVSTGEADEIDKSGSSPLREQDRFLPIANVNRIMKKSIPKTGKIAKDAKECVQECVSEFISFITSEASERCHQEKRKTINGEDILFAMSTLGFDNYVEPLKLYLQKYRESMKGEKQLNATGVRPESLGEDLDEDHYSTHTLTAANLITDQTVQQNIAYTSTYPTQIGQQIHYA